MVSCKEVCKIINESEQIFRECYSILNKFKNKEIINKKSGEIFKFQPKLATTLFKLDEYYRKIIQKEKKLIKNKKSYENKWFVKNLNSLNSYKKAINEAIEIGKGIGDSFAWIFYYRNTKFLNKHLEHQKISHTPPGIGGEAELQFIKNIFKFEEFFVLYHGITSFLRVGDVSLIDLKLGEVVALGEIKAINKDNKELNLSLHVIGPNKFGQNLSKLKKGGKPKKLPLNIESKLKIQLNNMGKFFDKNIMSIGKEDILNAYNIFNLQKLFDKITKKKIVIEKVSESLLIFGIRNNKKTLAKRILKEPRAQNNKIFEKVNLSSNVQNILDKSSSENQLILGELSINYFIGGTPIFWWPLQKKVLEKLFFKEIIFITIYNPYYFVKKLRESEFKITYTGVKWNFKISRLINGKTLSIENVNYFINAITYHLMKEEAIIELLLKLVEKAKNGEIIENSKTMIEITHIMI